MTKHRTLTQSLQKNELSEAALAFVNGGKAQPLESINPPEKEHQSQEVDEPVSGVISVSTRLPAELAANLVRVSLERKIRRQEPFTQQDIIVEALSDWLKKSGKAI